MRLRGAEGGRGLAPRFVVPEFVDLVHPLSASIREWDLAEAMHHEYPSEHHSGEVTIASSLLERTLLPHLRSVQHRAKKKLVDKLF